MPTISVIVPVYNTEKFLHRCVDSILAQTFSDFELILVDDGSTDRSGLICDQYAEIDIRVKVFHQINKGQAAARNVGVREATGRYLCFVDADDITHCRLMEILLNNLLSSGAPISICNAVESADIDPSFFQYKGDNKYTSYICDEAGLLSLLPKPYISWVVWGKLVDKNIVLKEPFTEGRIFEDNAVVVKWLYAAKKIVYTPDTLYFYQINPKGTTKSAWNENRIKDSFWYKTELLSFFAEHNMTSLFNKYYTPLLKALAEKYYRYKKGHPALAEDLKKTLNFWGKKYQKSARLTNGEKQYILSVIHPIRESLYEWVALRLRKKKQ